MKAGSEIEAAHNAETEVGSIAGQNVIMEIQLGFAEVKQLIQANTERIARQDERLAEHGRKLEALAEAGVERDRKLDVLTETSAVRMDALRRELRLVWGALGVLVTVLVAVFGLLFTG